MQASACTFFVVFCGGIGIIEGGKIAVYCDDNVVRVNERGSLGTCITGNQQDDDGMDPFLARTMVESLSKGINPLSGRVLPLNDSCSNEKIQDALIEILDLARSNLTNSTYFVLSKKRCRKESSVGKRIEKNIHVVWSFGVKKRRGNLSKCIIEELIST